MQDGPQIARPGYVGLIPGGRQDFPVDPVADKETERRVAAKRFLDNTPIHRRRRPAQETATCSNCCGEGRVLDSSHGCNRLCPVCRS